MELLYFLSLPLRAITFEVGCMIAESAVIGRFIGFVGSFMSMIVTCDASVFFSLIHMNLSDSMVSVLKVIASALIPTFCSCKCSVNLMGNWGAEVILFKYELVNFLNSVYIFFLVENKFYNIHVSDFKNFFFEF